MCPDNTFSNGQRDMEYTIPPHFHITLDLLKEQYT